MANLSVTQMANADLFKAILENANLTNASLNYANLYHANLIGATLEEAQLVAANLEKADLRGAKLNKALLYGANLKDANLAGADLSEANLEDANLSGADLSNTKIIGARLVGCSMNHTKLVNANLTNCNIYGISPWDIKTDDKTIMKDLIISLDSQPLMTIDDLEVAQFVYMIINNKNISKIIDTMRTKAVLILGSFDSQSMIVLESLKNTIRAHGYLPLLFTFEKPVKQELMETVRTMALMSKFVIVDISKRSGQYHELASIVPTTYIPFVTIARKGTRVTAMHREFEHQYWFCNEYIEYPKKEASKQIPALFETKILPKADEINSKINKRRK